MTTIGFKIYYGDGSVVSSKDAPDMFDAWKESPANDLCVVLMYFAETYGIWRDGVFHTENYKQILSATDYYAFDGATGYAFDAPDAPQDLPAGGAVKIGGLIELGRFDDLHNAANNDCVF